MLLWGEGPSFISCEDPPSVVDAKLRSKSVAPTTETVSPLVTVNVNPVHCKVALLIANPSAKELEGQAKSKISANEPI